MSVSIINHPFLIDFAKNDLSFTFQGNTIDTEGSNYITEYSFTRWATLSGKTFVVAYGNKTAVFTTYANEIQAANHRNGIPVTTSSANTLYMKDFLERFFIRNFELNQYCNITVRNETIGGVVYCILRFETKHPTDLEHAVSISTDAESGFTIARYSETAGTLPVLRPNYKILVQLYIDRYVDSVLENVATEPLYLSVNDAGRCTLPLDILRNYFVNVDVPAVDEAFDLYPLQHIYLRYRVHYAEVYGDVPTVRLMNASDDYFAINGKLNRRNSKLNRPDWTTIDPTVAISRCLKPRVYGIDTDTTVDLEKNTEKYLYIIYFNDTQSVNVVLKKTLRSYRSSQQITETVSIPGGNNIYRIPVSFAALFPGVDINYYFSYAVELIYSNETVFAQTFILKPKPYFAKEFLLHDRYGCLNTFVCSNEKTEKDIEGDELMLEGGRYVHITDASKQFVVRTGFKTKKEMQQLSEAVESQYNYKRVGNKLYRITILPDTLTIFDESEDLQSAEFTYKFTVIDEDIDSAAPVSITEGTMGSSVFNCRENNVWLDDNNICRTTAFNNLFENRTVTVDDEQS
ncbi:MAG: hypothetical protein PHR53_00920 [Bacteroidales bacterium]|nr:hypothetical protein [Bacteroidales bacterium]